jgi:apolipoprotein N-acyltransferase
MLGASAALGWAPFEAWPIAIICFVLLACLIKTAPPIKGFGLVSCFAFGLHGVGSSWVYWALHYKTSMALVPALLCTVVFIIYLSLFTALPCLMASGWIRLRTKWVGSYGHAAIWASCLTMGEWSMTLFFNGFVSMSLGHAMIDTWYSNYFPVGGAYLVSWLVFFTVFLLTDLIIARVRLLHKNTTKRRLHVMKADIRHTGITVIVVLAIPLLGWMLEQIEWTQPHGPALTFRLIQSIDDPLKKFEPQQINDALQQLTQSIKQQPATLIAVPETAFPGFLDQLPSEVLSDLQQYSATTQSHVFLGLFTQAYGADGYNTVLQIAPQQTSSMHQYNKTRLMPVGEYSPWGLGWLNDKLGFPFKNLAAGSVNQPPFELALNGKSIFIGTLVCHEELISRDAADRAKQSHLLLVPSNMAWFKDTFAVSQQLEVARVRAKEVARPILRIDNGGVTAHINEKGYVIDQLIPGRPGVLSGHVQPVDGTTWFTALGESLVVSLCLVVLALHFFFYLLSAWRISNTRGHQ